MMTYETGLSMEERVTSLFQPDTLMPDQYLETFRRKAPLEPEKKLLLAVLEDAISCFQKYLFVREGKGRVLFQDAEQWILQKDSDWLFSFNHVCEMLGFDADYLRGGLLQWKEEKLANHARARVYQLTPNKAKSKRRVSATKKQRMRKAVSR
ncbi:MAG TPA: hypothetical protein VE131_04775 [Terriglobales bacterium]|jgi:hypothetical protein|nr:hypothetical protein [Terriglobales bacterium]